MADEDAVVTAEETPSPDAELAAMLDAHAASILAYVEGVRTQVAEAVADMLTAVAVVHLGMEAQPVGPVQVVLVVAGKEQTVQVQV